MSRFTRREFLGVTGVGAAALATHVWIPKKAFADTPGGGRVKRLLILHAGGGMRSSCVFNAAVSPQWNPFGVVSKSDVDATGAPLLAAGAAWGVGTVLVGDKQPIPLMQWSSGNNLVKLPVVSQVADKISVLGAVDHDIHAPAGDGNHYSATLRMCTGAPDGTAGLLTMINRETDGKFPLPPTIIGGSGPIGASVFGVGAGDLSPYRAIFLNGLTDFRYPRAGGADSDPGYVKTLEGSLDQDLVARRAQALGGRPQSFVLAKQAGLKYGGVLAHPALRLPYAPTEALGMTTDGRALTSAMLSEPFGVAPAMGPAPTGFVSDNQWGPPTALAVRVLQLGAPAVAVGVSGWDFHSEEQRGLPPLAASLGRALSALAFVLPRIADPMAPGKSFWDSTLIAVTSEFGRDNTAESPDDGLTVGFNRGDGSDHHGTNASRYQALALSGGVISGGRLFAPTDEQCKPTSLAVPTQSLLATFMAALGLDASKYFPLPPIMDVFA